MRAFVSLIVSMFQRRGYVVLMVTFLGGLMKWFFTRNVKVRTCCKITLYRSRLRIFPIISFDLHSTSGVC